MKQLHKQSSATREDDELPYLQSPTYSPKSLKHPRSLSRPIGYIFREQRLLFILVGVLIGSVFFIIHPSLSVVSPPDPRPLIWPGSSESAVSYRCRNEFPGNFENHVGNRFSNGVGRVPVGIGGKRKRIVVTGGDDVIVIDNIFTGRKENVLHLFETLGSS